MPSLNLNLVLRITFSFFISLVLGINYAEAQTVLHSVYLIGDAGKDEVPGRVLQMLKQELDSVKTGTVIFLGDNIYPKGLTDENAKNRMLAQLVSVKDFKGNVVVVPGNHDWKQGLWQGPQILKKEEEFVEQYLIANSTAANKDASTFSPQNGLPGPETFLIANKIRLICIDTQWWLQSQFFHPTPKPNGLNRHQTTKLFQARLDSLMQVAKANNEQVVVAAHHPMFTMGHHGRPKQPLRFLVNWTPFQVFGLVGLNRMLVQDTHQPRYKRMKKRILSVLDNYPNTLYVSGHDHNLQHFIHKKNHYLVSGAGSKLSSIEHETPEAKLLNGLENGFMKVEFLESGHCQLKVWGSKSGWELYKVGLY